MQRLDMYVKETLGSRAKAQALIESGKVSINGKVIRKKSILLDSADSVNIDTSDILASRAGYKLKGFISELIALGLWQNDYMVDKCVLDIGASSGGFSEFMLESGARHITCVDVGSNQLSQNLVQDKRIKCVENCDIRDFSDTSHFDLVLCDVSFISLFKLLDCFVGLQSRAFIMLFKPQFEVGKEAKRNKKGVLKDKALGEVALRSFCSALESRGFSIVHIAKSAIKGKAGNEEIFIYAKR